jgi:SAM-dependent methyltransferase
MESVYDKIGCNYRSTRSADPRISCAVRSQFGAARTVLNIGAGAGSYEPDDIHVVAVEPSLVMIAQRPSGSAPVIQAVAEQLPFADNSFDLSLGVLTLHHWSNWELGLEEAVRVAGGNVLLLTWLGFRQHFWLTDYFPQIAELDSTIFPALAEYERILGDLTVTPVPIPHDCIDGFLYAYWRRPEAYLDPRLRNSISSFSVISNQESALTQLESDLDSGRWKEKYGEILEMDSYDHGYRLLRSTGL